MTTPIVASISSLAYKTVINSYEYVRTKPNSGTPTKKNDASFFFPLPVQMPADHYGAAVKDFNLGEIGTAIDTLSNLGGASLGESIAATVVTGGLAAAVIASLTGRAGSAVDKFVGAGAIVKEAVQPFIGAYGGMTRNPHTALLFDAMNLRSFSFNFRIAPRNASESRSVNSTLREIKQRMHPSFNSFVGAFALDYPYLFEVDFIGFDKSIEGLPRVSPAFLTDFNVSNASQGNAFYKSGQPVFIDISMTFKEIDMKTRESLGWQNPNADAAAAFLRDPAGQLALRAGLEADKKQTR